MEGRSLKEGLEAPLDAPKARAMMASMGWAQGESLGADSSGGLLTPLAPDMDRDYFHG